MIWIVCALVTVAGCGASRTATPSVPAPQAAVVRTSFGMSGSNHEHDFADGYQAFTRRDYQRAADQFKSSIDNSPDLADYALFYLAKAEQELGDQAAATAAFKRIVDSYPDSIHRPDAELSLAQGALKDAHPEVARDLASDAVLHPGPSGDAAARLTLAHALAALGDFKSAYNQAEDVRFHHPLTRDDWDARSLVHELRSGHPELSPSSAAEHQTEAELLLSEGQRADALDQIEQAIDAGGERGELLWLRARAYHSQGTAERDAVRDYLAAAPRGQFAPEALYALARSFWHEGNTAKARTTFSRLARGFPQSRYAAIAMLDIGRTYEEDRAPNEARAQYERIIARYSQTDAALEARFRSPWLLYQAGRFEQAARKFEQMAAASAAPADVVRFQYWQARALQKAGHPEEARQIYQQLAVNTDTNYYPELAARRVGMVPASFPAASASDPPHVSAPELQSTGEFHLLRAIALESAGLPTLAQGELKVLLGGSYHSPQLDSFLLAALQNSGDYHDALTLATAMERRGELSKETAERARYPRAYWALISEYGRSNSLDPILILALTRQESLFNPTARSGSDARGLMQLLPVTAEKVASQTGGASGSLDLYDPELNVRLGSAYLSELMRMFNGDIFKAVAAYNGGEHAVQKWNAKYGGDDDEWVEQIEYHETRDYVKKVIGGMREYRLIYGG